MICCTGVVTSPMEQLRGRSRVQRGFLQRLPVWQSVRNMRTCSAALAPSAWLHATPGDGSSGGMDGFVDVVHCTRTGHASPSPNRYANHLQGSVIVRACSCATDTALSSSVRETKMERTQQSPHGRCQLRMRRLCGQIACVSDPPITGNGTAGACSSVLARPGDRGEPFEVIRRARLDQVQTLNRVGSHQLCHRHGRCPLLLCRTPEYTCIPSFAALCVSRRNRVHWLLKTRHDGSTIFLYNWLFLYFGYTPEPSLALQGSGLSAENMV